MSLDAPPPGPAGHLLRSVVRLGGSVLAAAETRFELLATEVNEDATRGVRLLGFALAALFTGLLGALMAGATVIIVFWDTHRVTAAVVVTAIFFGAALFCSLVFRQRLREKPRLLDATRSELKKDLAAIRSHQ